MYQAIHVANWFVMKAHKENIRISTMKLIKLCFIAQGFHLSYYREALFSDSVQAWQYGPVINMLYEHFKNCKNQSIPHNHITLEWSDRVSDQDEETIEVLESVWEKFKNKTAFQLSSWTHRKGSSWDIAYNHEHGKDILAYEISHKLIIDEFDKIIKNHGQSRKNKPFCYIMS